MSIVSQNLSGRGYGGSNYTLSIQGDGSAVLETVQRDKSDNLAFWKIALRGDELHGSLNMRTKLGGVEMYTVTSVMPAAAQPAPVEEAAPKKK